MRVLVVRESTRDGAMPPQQFATAEEAAEAIRGHLLALLDVIARRSRCEGASVGVSPFPGACGCGWCTVRARVNANLRVIDSVRDVVEAAGQTMDGHTLAENRFALPDGDTVRLTVLVTGR